jgi:predicted secreted protein
MTARTFGEADNGSTIALAAGEVLEVELDEHPTTGYRWKLARTPECCVLRHDAFDAPPPGSPPGAGGRHTWRFQAEGPCAGRLVIELRPTPGRGDAAVRAFSLDLAAPQTAPG